MNNEKQIKRANKKALPKFLLMLLFSGLIGGAIGYYSVIFGLDNISDKLAVAGEFFGTYIAPFLLAAAAIALPTICMPIFFSAKKLLQNLDDEDEETYDKADNKLSKIIWVSSILLIFSFFLIAAAYSGGFSFLESDISVLCLIAIVAFFIIMVEVILIQQKSVDAVKQINPEKTASVYDMKFKEKWFNSCDEAERMIVGMCAYKSFSATNTVCSILAVVLAVAALIFDIGFLPSLSVCIIWFVNQFVYFKESIKLSKSGNKIM